MSGWTAENVRHIASMLRYGSNPASTVYDSIGEDFFLALAPGWLNLGMWEGDGSDPEEAPRAVEHLVEVLAEPLMTGGDVLDVGNGLGAQDAVIRRVVRPLRLAAVNITRSQLVAGSDRLAEAGALPINGDASALPVRSRAFDGVISVEAAFHFSSRLAFFREARRVLRPGGVISLSDVPTLRWPRTPAEFAAAASQLRVWGLRKSAAARPEEMRALLMRAGFEQIEMDLVGERVIAPALRFVRDRLRRKAKEVPRTYAAAASFMVSQVELLWEHRLVDYALITARRP
jgi:erythromycin 3''-O-methyltransferase